MEMYLVGDAGGGVALILGPHNIANRASLS